MRLTNRSAQQIRWQVFRRTDPERIVMLRGGWLDPGGVLNWSAPEGGFWLRAWVEGGVWLTPFDSAIGFGHGDFRVHNADLLEIDPPCTCIRHDASGDPPPVADFSGWIEMKGRWEVSRSQVWPRRVVLYVAGAQAPFPGFLYDDAVKTEIEAPKWWMRPSIERKSGDDSNFGNHDPDRPDEFWHLDQMYYPLRSIWKESAFQRLEGATETYSCYDDEARTDLRLTIRCLSRDPFFEDPPYPDPKDFEFTYDKLVEPSDRPPRPRRPRSPDRRELPRPGPKR